MTNYAELLEELAQQEKKFQVEKDIQDISILTWRIIMKGLEE